MDKIYWIKLQKKILCKTGYIKHIIKKYLIYVKYIKKNYRWIILTSLIKKYIKKEKF